MRVWHGEPGGKSKATGSTGCRPGLGALFIEEDTAPYCWLPKPAPYPAHTIKSFTLFGDLMSFTDEVGADVIDMSRCDACKKMYWTLEM